MQNTEPLTAAELKQFPPARHVWVMLAVAAGQPGPSLHPRRSSPDFRLGGFEWSLVLGDVRPRDPDHLLVLTETHRYAIQPYAPAGSATWAMATITSIVARSEASLPSMGEVHALRHGIEIVTTKEEASTRLARLRSDALDWVVGITPTATVTVDEETKTLQQGILLVLALEALLRALEVLPVKTVGWRSENGRSIVQIAPREDGRDEIAAAIGERSTSDVLDRLFDKDDLGIDVEWVLSTSGGLASGARSETTARFLSDPRGGLLWVNPRPRWCAGCEPQQARADLQTLDQHAQDFGVLIIRFLKLVFLSILRPQDDVGAREAIGLKMAQRYLHAFESGGGPSRPRSAPRPRRG
jgi:hypothetical protein